MSVPEACAVCHTESGAVVICKNGNVVGGEDWGLKVTKIAKGRSHTMIIDGTFFDLRMNYSFVF